MKAECGWVELAIGTTLIMASAVLFAVVVFVLSALFLERRGLKRKRNAKSD